SGAASCSVRQSSRRRNAAADRREETVAQSAAQPRRQWQATLPLSCQFVSPAELSLLDDATSEPFASGARGRCFGLRASTIIFANHSLQRPAVDLAQRVARQRIDHP